MSAADGVSLPTTLAQAGTVAKTQAKGQQVAAQTTPFADQLNRDDDLRVSRIKETESATKQKLDPDKKNPDKRKRRRLKRNRKQFDESNELAEEEMNGTDIETEGTDDEDSPEEQLGVLIDMRV